MKNRSKLMKISALVLCAALTALPLAGCTAKTGGESTDNKKKIGIIQYAPHASLDNCYKGLLEGLKEAGFADGEGAVIDFKNAMGVPETTQQLAKNMVNKKYDLIIGIATPAAAAAFSAALNTDIPTVFCAVSDPLKAELVKSLDKPGNNCTGTSDLLNVEGQLKLIRAFQPDAKKIGILYTTDEANSLSQISEFERLAPNYGFEIVKQGIQNGSEVAINGASLAAKVDCITNLTDNNVVNNLNTLFAKANEAKIPVYGSEVEQVTRGCLAAESLDYIALGKQTGAIAARVLNGEAAGNVPVGLVKDSQPVINTDVAAQFNLAIPEAYAGADKVTTSAE